MNDKATKKCRRGVFRKKKGKPGVKVREKGRAGSRKAIENSSTTVDR